MKVVKNQLKELRGTQKKDRITNPENGEFLDSLPSPVHDHYNEDQIKYYQMMGNFLIETKKLKKQDLPNVEAWAIYYDQFIQATKHINLKGYEGGLVQKFKGGATNVSGHVTIQEKAFSKMLQISRIFGLSLRDRADLESVYNSEGGQMDLFQEFLNKKNA